MSAGGNCSWTLAKPTITEGSLFCKLRLYVYLWSRSGKGVQTMVPTRSSHFFSVYRQGDHMEMNIMAAVSPSLMWIEVVFHWIFSSRLQPQKKHGRVLWWSSRDSLCVTFPGCICGLRSVQLLSQWCFCHAAKWVCVVSDQIQTTTVINKAQAQQPGLNRATKLHTLFLCTGLCERCWTSDSDNQCTDHISHISHQLAT